ncbi:WD repeat-containing protein 36 isoform X1 [Hydra vulgaris]|uniref:WD repeat-containing protein 36 isoform X1 n=1 Tax=Hydra vulgaris TaxID=6087 RepID=UPI001F5E8C22|nr:WD repeat-containing protein 36 [Hydra vulgaris]
MVKYTSNVTKKESQIFAPYRAVGFVSNHIPLNLEVKGTEHFVTTVVGASFHIYNAGKLNLLFVGEPLTEQIAAVISVNNTHIVAAGCNVYLFERGKTKKKYVEHQSDVHSLLSLGEHVVSIDCSNTVNVWELENLETYVSFALDSALFTVTTCVHPSTYLNKVLFGSKQGTLQLWNVKTCKLIHEFKGWNASVMVLEQAPAVDVIAIGLENGRIILENIKFEVTMMTFYQEYGPVTALSFRTDGTPVMASGSSLGNIVFWDLEKKQTINMIEKAHSSSVTGMKFFHKQPLLITSAPDNSLKIWIFDNPDGSARLFKFRSGHSAPPTRTLFYGSYGNVVLTTGMDQTLRFTSIMRGEQCHEFSQGSLIKKAGKHGVKVQALRLPPITCIAAETLREHDWDNIVTCHLKLPVAKSWSTEKRAIGKHEFGSFKATVKIPTCCDISSCGNFTVIGYKNGNIEKFNLQSGIKRLKYGKKLCNGHTSTVRGVCIDNANMMMISAAADKAMKFWNFKNGNLLCSISFDYPIMQTKLHRESSLLAVSFDDFSIQIIDIDSKKMVRTFVGHSNIITDMSWSSDARWLLSSSMDGTIRTWDVPSSRLVDCFMVDTPASSVAFSPTSEFLATTHQDDVGIYLWSNKVTYSGVHPSPLPNNYEPILLSLPKTHVETDDPTENLEEPLEEKEITSNVEKYISPDQLGDYVITLSLLPDSKWKCLTSLELIKSRNKPKEPPKKPEAAPFFLPTVAGLELTFDKSKGLTGGHENTSESRLTVVKKFHEETSLQKSLREFEKFPDAHKVNEVIEKLKLLTPSETDIQFRTLSPELGGDVDLLTCQIRVLEHALKLGKDYEIVQAYIALFLKLHGDLIISTEQLRTTAADLLDMIKNTWSECDELLDESLCLIKYFKSATV